MGLIIDLGGLVGLLGCFLGRFFMYQGGDQGRVALALHQLVLQFADAGLDRLHLGISDFLVVGFELKTGQEVVQQKAVLVVLEPCPSRASPLLWNLQIDGLAELQGVGPQHHRVGLVVHHAEGLDQQDHARVDALLWHVFEGTPILARLQGLEPRQRVDFSVGIGQGVVGHLRRPL